MRLFRSIDSQSKFTNNRNIARLKLRSLPLYCCQWPLTKEMSCAFKMLVMNRGYFNFASSLTQLPAPCYSENISMRSCCIIENTIQRLSHILTENAEGPLSMIYIFGRISLENTESRKILLNLIFICQVNRSRWDDKYIVNEVRLWCSCITSNVNNVELKWQIDVAHFSWSQTIQKSISQMAENHRYEHSPIFV